MAEGALAVVVAVHVVVAAVGAGKWENER